MEICAITTLNKLIMYAIISLDLKLRWNRHIGMAISWIRERLVHKRFVFRNNRYRNKVTCLFCDGKSYQWSRYT